MTRLHLATALAALTLVACGSAAAVEAPRAGHESGSEATEAIPNARHPLPGLLTGGQPTEAQLEAVAREGYTTVISLRTDTEEVPFDERAVVEGLGMNHVSIPTSGKTGVHVENARALAEALDAAGEGPVLLHCGSGNRSGALLALKAFHVDGATREAALDLGTAAGMTKLRPTVEALLVREE